MSPVGASRKRDPAFLQMAAVAGIGGAMAIVFSIGFPIWASYHGRPYTPVFSLFAAWGVAALAGAYACIATYRLSDVPPPRPPRGGERVAVRAAVVALPAAPIVQDAPERRAA